MRKLSIVEIGLIIACIAIFVLSFRIYKYESVQGRQNTVNKAMEYCKFRLEDKRCLSRTVKLIKKEAS